MGGKKKKGSKKYLTILVTLIVVLLIISVGAPGIAGGLFSQLDTTYIIIAIIVLVVGVILAIGVGAAIVYFIIRLVNECKLERFQAQRENLGLGKFTVVVPTDITTPLIDTSPSAMQSLEYAAAPLVMMGGNTGMGAVAPPNSFVPMAAPGSVGIPTAPQAQVGVGYQGAVPQPGVAYQGVEFGQQQMGGPVPGSEIVVMPADD